MAAAAEYGCDFAHINQLVGAEAYFEDLRLQLIQEDRYVNAFCIFNWLTIPSISPVVRP